MTRAPGPWPGAARDLPLRVRTYGESADADYRVGAVVPRGMTVGFEVSAGPAGAGGRGSPRRCSSRVPGRHNALNATAVLATCLELGFPADAVTRGLAAYRGARRRLELKGEADGVRVLDSYAHHPTELAADLAAARDIAEGGRVIAIFQPHLFSRTRIFAAELGAALGRADEAFVLDVYPGPRGSGAGRHRRAGRRGRARGRAHFVPDRAAVPGAVAATAKPGDLVLTMGAGDVTALGQPVLDALRARGGPAG